MDCVEKIVKKVLEIESKALLKQMEVLDYEVVGKIVKLFSDCNGKIIVTGCGTSGAAAQKIKHTLCCVNKAAMYMNPADSVHGGLGVVKKDDIVIFVSKGGCTPELIPLAEVSKKIGATTIIISENNESILAELCDLWLQVKVEQEPDDFNMLATASTLSVISVMDAIAICVMKETNYTKEQFGLIHPGGAVGKRLV